jgi:glycine cleavage system H protein
MATVRGCLFPEDRYYLPDGNVWARIDDETLWIGMTAYACALSGEIVSFMPKKPGKEVVRERSLATVESGKWVGPVSAPVSGVIVEVNDAVVSRPGLLNEDPYDKGWLIRLSPTDWETESRSLISGTEAASVFEAKMQAEGFEGCPSVGAAR